ncbi:hypothetical protein [Mesorhizobium loti]|uniref:hypothetical protein n=1 Tax=Rhizobium loti TaxID=381 RepID=UPI000403F804|nr:hypothetical protein [Mesorhizobium loti]
MRQTILLSALASGVLTGCANDGDDYTLYRGSVTGPMRIHVASFDSADGEAYNRENCHIAAGLFQAQPGVAVKYWCEKGRYRE